ncbi:unnamed protein product [Caenorhabditis angaria]|uniref:Uncharacterized protein n=1 Tax=Caenorhabditis angaria TaxID=860376 RepID=A0A9P1N925_9PELO|nr:unnamed protein product [Caenorhabditis angaria]
MVLLKSGDMWLVVLCFVLPAIIFSLFALVAWLRVLQLNYRRRIESENAEREAKKKATQIESLITKKDGKVFCNIPIKVEDIETGAMFLYNSDENLAINIVNENELKEPLVDNEEI